MTRAQWLTAGSWLLLFWLLAGMVWAPALERRLERRAAELLAEADTGHEPARARFDGQRAIVTGRVRHPAMREDIASRLRHGLRAPGLFSAKLNPVTELRDEMELSPYPPGWLLLAVSGKRAELAGLAATEHEARDLARLLEERWLAAGGRMDSRVAAAPERFDEAQDVTATLEHFPSPPQDSGPDSARLYLARIGGAWERLQPDMTDDALKQRAEPQGVLAADWSLLKVPVYYTRKYQDNERARLAEQERQSRLPPPHVILAARAGRLLARGEVALLAQKREFLNTLIQAFPDWRVLDDLRVNPARRAITGYGPVTSALLPQDAGGKSLALGLPGKGWHIVDWLEEDEEGAGKDWRAELPADLPQELVAADMRMAADWLTDDAQGIPSLPIPAQPSFLTLTLLPDKAILAGQIAEEPLRMRLVQAARLVYAGRTILLADGLLARGTCEPTADVEQTVRSLPPPPRPGQPPVLAFARPGEVWRALPAAEPLLAPGALAGSPLLPEDFPAAMAEDTFAEGFDHLRHHWRNAVNHATKEAAP